MVAEFTISNNVTEPITVKDVLKQALYARYKTGKRSFSKSCFGLSEDIYSAILKDSNASQGVLKPEKFMLYTQSGVFKREKGLKNRYLNNIRINVGNALRLKRKLNKISIHGFLEFILFQKK